jgi:hypothetical protein
MKRMMFWRSMIAILLCSPAMVSQVRPDQNQSANDLVREIVRNELKALDQDHTCWMYRLETEKGGTRDVLEVAETKQGDLTRLIAKGGQPLSAEQRAEEDKRTEAFINNSQQQKRRQQEQNEDIRKARQLLALLPDALNFSFAERNGDTAKLNFQPNPAFHPPSRAAHTFQEMEGQLIVDEKQKRLMEIHGHLENAVHFGILGHLDPGGTFDVRQQEVAPNHWEITFLKVNMKGKALFFKNIDVQQHEMRSDFRQVPETLTLSQAKDLLQKQDAGPALLSDDLAN